MENEVIEINGNRQWLQTMADMHEEFDNRINSLTKRVAKLENNSDGSAIFEVGDPLKPLVTVFVLMFAAELLIPLISKLIERGKK